MDGLIPWGVNLAQHIQNLGPGWAAPMRWLTFLGTEEFYLLLMPGIYWCLEGALGLRLGVLLVVGSGLNSALKLAFHAPRPYWVSAQVRGLSAEASFGLPSGHAQNAVTLWGAAAARVRRWWAWGVALAMALGIGLSRIYLGVHFPQDVLAGWAVGAVVLAVALGWEERVTQRWRASTPAQRRLLALAAALVLFALGWGARLRVEPTQVPTAWAQQALAATGQPIAPLRLAGVIAPAAVLLGMLWGLAPQQGPYAAQRGGWGLKALRYGVGMLGLSALYLGLRTVLPSGEDLLGSLARALRYALVGWWITGGAPLLFARLRLDGGPDPSAGPSEAP